MPGLQDHVILPLTGAACKTLSDFAAVSSGCPSNPRTGVGDRPLKLNADPYSRRVQEEDVVIVEVALLRYFSLQQEMSIAA